MEKKSYSKIEKSFSRTLKALLGIGDLGTRFQKIQVIREEKQEQIDSILNKGENNNCCPETMSNEVFKKVELALKKYEKDEVENIDIFFPLGLENLPEKFPENFKTDIPEFEKFTANSFLNQIKSPGFYMEDDEIEKTIKRFYKLKTYVEKTNFSTNKTNNNELKETYLEQGYRIVYKLCERFYNEIQHPFTSNPVVRVRQFDKTMTKFIKENSEAPINIENTDLRNFLQEIAYKELSNKKY